MAIFRRALLAVALIATAGMVAAACGDEADTANNPSQASVDAINERIQRNEMMFAVIELGGLGLHDMDVALNEDETIDSSFVPITRTAIRLLALTNWTPEFQEDAASVREDAEALLAALQADDLEAAKQHATALHGSEHDLNAAVWNHLAADLPEDAGGPQGGHGDESSDDSGGRSEDEEGDDHSEDEGAQ